MTWWATKKHLNTVKMAFDFFIGQASYVTLKKLRIAVIFPVRFRCKAIVLDCGYNFYASPTDSQREPPGTREQIKRS
ncbi:hypothetical protein KIN_43210 [Litoreibacter roseus]|uniref:Uncharacterized protein n=1 Tax=Litoreibacter roseus TaxID=2601869 RepID=A0A6N6JMK8_9RHOB|nr:hypothetical protein KIN_43210 [Litoreibacter roseus]